MEEAIIAVENEILLVTREANTKNDVDAVLSAKEHYVLVGVCQNVASLVRRLERTDTPIVLIDIDSQPMQMLEELAPIVNKFVHARFVVISSERGSDLVLKAMQVGVRHIQIKKTIKSELGTVLEGLIKTTQSQAGQHGVAITVLSASGGCGCTTLAVNLANELRLNNSERVLLVDLDYNYGSIATYLDLHGKFGVADVLTHEAGIDTQLINTTVVSFSENLDVLMSPVSANSLGVNPPEPEKLGALLASCKRSYAFTVFDAPRISIDAAATLAGDSGLILIVLQLLVPDVRVTKMLLSALIRSGISEDRIMAIVNRYRKRGNMVDLEGAEKALHGISLFRLSNDYTSVIRALNYGTPLADTAPKSAIRRDLIQLASQLVDSKVRNNGRLHIGEP